MAKECPICKKGSLVAGGYSNRTRAEKFQPTGKKRRFPNLQWATFSADCPKKEWAGKRIKVCTSCLKKGFNVNPVLLKKKIDKNK